MEGGAKGRDAHMIKKPTGSPSSKAGLGKEIAFESPSQKCSDLGPATCYMAEQGDGRETPAP